MTQVLEIIGTPTDQMLQDAFGKAEEFSSRTGKPSRDIPEAPTTPDDFDEDTMVGPMIDLMEAPDFEAYLWAGLINP